MAQTSSSRSVQAAFLRPRAFAEYLGVSPRHVHTLLREGLPHVRVGSSHIRIPVEPAINWLQERTAQRTPGGAR